MLGDSIAAQLGGMVRGVQLRRSMVLGSHPNVAGLSCPELREAQRPPFLSSEADKQFPQKRMPCTVETFNFPWHTRKETHLLSSFYPRTSNSRSRGHRPIVGGSGQAVRTLPTDAESFLGPFRYRPLVTQSAETGSCPIWLSSLASVCHSAAECHHNTCFCRQLLPFGNCHACGVDMYCTVPIHESVLFLPSSKMPEKMTALFPQHIKQWRAHPQTVFGSPNPFVNPNDSRRYQSVIDSTQHHHHHD